MGFYLRKGINLGLLRLNFSKSGIGVSLGFKGLRIGSNTGGNYIHAGRKGIYYKKTLPGGRGCKLPGWLKMVLVLLIVLVLFIYFTAKIDWDKIRMFILE